MKGDWPLRDFELRADEWRAREVPTLRQELAVWAWIEWLRHDPYRDAKPVPDLGLPWWFAVIRESEENGTIVTCTMRIDEEHLESICSHFATLTLPVGF